MQVVQSYLDRVTQLGRMARLSPTEASAVASLGVITQLHVVINNKRPQAIHYDRDIIMVITCTYYVAKIKLHINLINQRYTYNKITCF